MPTAAAIAVATATAAQANLPKKADGPAIHKDVAAMTHDQGMPTPRAPGA